MGRFYCPGGVHCPRVEPAPLRMMITEAGEICGMEESFLDPLHQLFTPALEQYQKLPEG